MMDDFYTQLIAELQSGDYGGMSDDEAAPIIDAQTVPAPYRMVFGSFRTLAAILTDVEYNTLRAALNAAVQQETDAGGTRLADMVEMLRLPGDAEGNGGGLDLGSEGVVQMLAYLGAFVEDLAAVPGKIAAYVASQQPPPVRKWKERVYPGHVESARKKIEEQQQ